jgi:hypothetical protein
MATIERLTVHPCGHTTALCARPVTHEVRAHDGVLDGRYCFLHAHERFIALTVTESAVRTLARVGAILEGK